MYLLSCLTGLTQGSLPVALYYLRSPSSKIPITAEQGAWLSAALGFGRLFSALPAGMLTDLVGRRKVCLCAGAIYAVVWFVLPFAKSFGILVVCNLSLGIGVALVNVANQMHMSEVVCASYRGSFHAVNGFYHNFGQLFIATIGVYFTYSTVCFVNSAAVLIYFAAAYWLVESPYYLLMRGDEPRAERNFQWLRTGVPADERERELTKIKDNIEFQKRQTGSSSSSIFSDLTNLFKPLSDPINRRCVMVVLGLNLLDVQTGTDAIKLNSSFIFTAKKLINQPIKYQFVISCVQFVASFFASFVIEKFARRTLFIGASSLIGSILIATATLFYLAAGEQLIKPFGRHRSGDDDAVSIACFAAVLIYYGFHNLTLHSSINMQRCELLPQNVKAVGTGLAILVQAGSSAVSILIFQYVLSAIGLYANFAWFAVCAILMAVFVYAYMPEIKGRTLAEIYDSMYGSISRR